MVKSYADWVNPPEDGDDDYCYRCGIELEDDESSFCQYCIQDIMED